jgi:hypothetical protein
MKLSLAAQQLEQIKAERNLFGPIRSYLNWCLHMSKAVDLYDLI